MEPATTIASLQTPPGRGGIAVIVLAGPDAESILDAAFAPLGAHAAGGPGALQLGHIVRDGEPIDEAIVHRFDGGAEINIHGGPVAARAAMERLAALGARPVEPADAAALSAPALPAAHPELDNPAVGDEMLALLPNAGSELVVTAIAHQWSGGLSRLARRVLDSPSTPDGADFLRRAAAGLAEIERLLDPPEVVLAGPPNAGKSALANALVGREVSLVHDREGTTRDWVREPAAIDGAPIWLTDTAGIWDVTGAGAAADIDAESVRRARHRVERADLVVLLEAGRQFDAPDWLDARNVLRVAAQCDRHEPRPWAEVNVSAVTGEGLDALRRLVLQRLGMDRFDPARPRAFTPRQAELLTRAAGAMDRGDRPAATGALGELLTGPRGDATP